MLKPLYIDDIWPKIEADVRSMLVDPEEFGPERVLEQCRAGNAWCLECEDGYVIVQIMVNGKTGLREFVAWLALLTFGDRPGAFERVTELLRIEARRFECVNVVFYSPLRGWARKAPTAGWRLRSAEYVLPVETCH